MLRVAIVHYHLKRGGVTRVIESTLAGFAQIPEPPQVVVLSGEVPEDCAFAEHAKVVDGLHYSNTQEHTPSPEELLKRLEVAARDALGAPPDIWHIHNHSLGKNSAIPGLVSLLAEAGEAVLLHMHDFAEDGRPQNYALNQTIPEHAQKLYPISPRVHYAVLNGRDQAIFAQTELSNEQLHQLPNAVEAEAQPPNPSAQDKILNHLGAERLLLYPVRALRRKNFGEALLWSTLAEPGECLATTLGPTNQNYVAAHQSWIDLAKEYDLPFHFAIGQSNDFAFEDIMGTADAILTTSITEGFGLAFLEPWLFGKPILGRDLPPITEDFKGKGIALDGLYENLPIPKAWIDLQALETALSEAITNTYQVYGKTPPPTDAVDCAIEAISPSPSTIDFGGLNEALQTPIIRKLAEDSSAKEALRTRLADGQPDSTSLQANAELIRDNYNARSYAANVYAIYETLANASTDSVDYLNPDTILEAFLKPESFRLLKT